MSYIEHIYIDDNVYPILLRLLRNRTGLNFEYYRRKHIEKRIKSRMIRVKCDTLNSYYDYLFSNEGEFRQFIDGFNINYTFFFRDWEVWETFQNIILSSLNYNKNNLSSHIKPKASQLAKFRTKKNKIKNLEKKGKIQHYTDIKNTVLPHLGNLALFKKLKQPLSELKIWSCPCASGEESYTIAMILDNLSKQIGNLIKFKIIASDIDSEAILKALTGIYKETSMKEIADYYKNIYFKKIPTMYGQEYIVSEDIKKYLEFYNEDVTKGHQTSNTYDIIFCRYLLIYFNRTNRDNFIRIVKSRLNHGGLLILGKTETLFDRYKDLKQIDANNQIYLKTSYN